MLFLVAFFALASVRMPVRAEAARAPEPISLQQLLARALSDPPRVLAARAALARADAERGMAQAGYFPSLTMQASEGISYDNRQQIPDAFVNQLVDLLNPIYDALDITVPANASDQAKTRLEALSQQVGGTAQLDWSLVNVARRKAIQATTQGRDAQQFAVSGAQRLALAAACDLYMRALASSQFVADAEITEERRRQQHEGIGGLVKAGLRPPVDETRARIEAVAAKYRLEVRRVEERAAFAALAVSVGRDPNRPLRPQPLAASPFSVPQTLEEATAAAFEYRPELKTLRVSLLGRQAELSAALWRRAPTLGISGTANASYIDQIKGEGYQGSQYSTAAQVYLRVQTFDASIWRSANVARANMLQAQRALEITTLDVKAEVADASFATERAHAELERATQVLAAAGAAREAQNGRYQTGVASLLELLDAEAVEQNARFDRIQAERDHQLANVRLLAATGLIRQLAR
jgi:outer membrane protein